MERSQLLRETLTDHIFTAFIANKKAEIEEYNVNVSGEFDKQVSSYEVEKYLRFL
jgi:glutamine synthetase